MVSAFGVYGGGLGWTMKETVDHGQKISGTAASMDALTAAFQEYKQDDKNWKNKMELKIEKMDDKINDKLNIIGPQVGANVRIVDYLASTTNQ